MPLVALPCIAASESGQALRPLLGGVLALTLQKPPRPSSTGAPSACLQTSMSSARTEGTDHFWMSLKEPPLLPDACLDATVAALPAPASSREDCPQQPGLSLLGGPEGPGLLAPILEEALPNAVEAPQRRRCHHTA